MKGLIENYFGPFLNTAIAELTPDGRYIEDVDYIDITNNQEDPGEEAYCVPI